MHNHEVRYILHAEDVLPNIRRPPKGPKNAVFVPGDLDL